MTFDIFKIYAIAMPFGGYITYDIYHKTKEISVLGIIFIIAGFVGLHYWIQEYRKEKWLKENIEWIN